MSDRPPTNIYVHSRLVNENSHKYLHVLVIKEPCLSRHCLVIVMKKVENNTDIKLHLMDGDLVTNNK